jgi:dynein heavy chain
MLSLVVANERKDLEERYVENSKEAFENIRSLKEIENNILEQLKIDVIVLLGDENLIRILQESKSTAELIATKLKSIGQTQHFMKRQREVYGVVAERASLLYFVVQDLSKVNSMY